jgi:phosphoribosyl-ATP pyrophosphohydrolase
LKHSLRSKAKLSKTQEEATIMNGPLPTPGPALTGPQPASEAIGRLWSALDDHVKLRTPVPERTARLVSAGEPKMAQKVVEEAGEVAVAAMVKDRTEVVRESADLIYHLTTLWAAIGIRPEEVWAEMAAREAAYGLAEKRAKPRRRE